MTCEKCWKPFMFLDADNPVCGECRAKTLLKDISQKLWDAQAKLNDGRGVSTIRSVCSYLNTDNLDDAKTCARTDFDKIRSYPELAKLVQEHLDSSLR